MPDPQSTNPEAAGAPVALIAVLPVADDSDYALGCECADPALQIDWWRSEAAPPAQA